MLETAVNIQAHAREVEEQGFTIIPNQVPPVMVEAMNVAADRALDAVSAAMAVGTVLAHTEINPFVRAARCLYSWSPKFQDLLVHETVYQLGQAVLSKPRLWDMTALEARPLPEGQQLGSFDWHRDFDIAVDDKGQSYLWVFTCLTDVTAENGATWVIPCSHRDRSIATPKAGGVSANRPVSARQLTAKAGDMVAINPAMLHAVGENRTSRGRRLALVAMCREERAPLLNHNVIARPLLEAGGSERLRQLLRTSNRRLDETWGVLPEEWPRGTSADGAVRRLWQRLRRSGS